MCVYVGMSLCMYVFVCVCIYVCMFVFRCVCVSVCMCVYVCVCVVSACACATEQTDGHNKVCVEQLRKNRASSALLHSQ